MMGITSDNAGEFGDVEKEVQVFVRNELAPLQERMKENNDWLMGEIVKFRNYSLDVFKYY